MSDNCGIGYFLRAKKIYTEIEEIEESLNELHAMSNAGKLNLKLGARKVHFEGEKAKNIKQSHKNITQ